jgi:hypothetical protein
LLNQPIRISIVNDEIFDACYQHDYIKYIICDYSTSGTLGGGC